MLQISKKNKIIINVLHTFHNNSLLWNAIIVSSVDTNIVSSTEKIKCDVVGALHLVVFQEFLVDRPVDSGLVFQLA